MSPLFGLILGHLIGDFVLQTVGLVHYKAHSWKGLLLHAAIVTASCALCLWRHLPTWWPWLLPLFLLHLVTDWAKVTLNQRIANWKTRLFFLDQLAHIVVILLVVLIQGGGWPYRSLAEAIGGGTPEANRNLALLAAFIGVFFVVPLLEAQAAYALTRYVPQPRWPGNGNGVAATMRDRLWGGAERTIALLLLYLGFTAVWFAPLAFIPRILALRPVWQQPPQARVYRVKIATSILCTIAIGLLLWFAQRALA